MLPKGDYIVFLHLIIIITSSNGFGWDYEESSEEDSGEFDNFRRPQLGSPRSRGTNTEKGENGHFETENTKGEKESESTGRRQILKGLRGRKIHDHLHDNKGHKGGHKKGDPVRWSTTNGNGAQVTVVDDDGNGGRRGTGRRRSVISRMVTCMRQLRTGNSVDDDDVIIYGPGGTISSNGNGGNNGCRCSCSRTADLDLMDDDGFDLT